MIYLNKEKLLKQLMLRLKDDTENESKDLL